MPLNQNPPNEDLVFLFDLDIPRPYSDDSDSDSMPSLVTESDSGLDDSMFFEFVRHIRESNDSAGDGASKVPDLVPESTDENEDMAHNNTDAEEEEYEWTSEDEIEGSDKNEALNAGPIRTVSDIEGEGDGNRGNFALLFLFYSCAAIYILNCVVDIQNVF